MNYIRGLQAFSLVSTCVTNLECAAECPHDRGGGEDLCRGGDGGVKGAPLSELALERVDHRHVTRVP